MSPLVLFVCMVLSFAAMMTAHVAIVIGLAGRAPRYHALVAVVLPPLGAFWSFREKRFLRGAGWAIAAIAYLAVRLLG